MKSTQEIGSSEQRKKRSLKQAASKKNKVKAPLREVKTLIAVKKNGVASTTLYWNVKVFRGNELIASNSFIETRRTEELYAERPYLKENRK